MFSRAFNNLTARFNGLYYSTLNINEGIYKIEQNHKDNFEKTLPVFIYPTNESAKSTFTDFDNAIKKSTRCIRLHAIKDKKNVEIPSAGKWIDDNWINIGIAMFYKREMFNAIDNFEYVIRMYIKSKDKYSAMLWNIRVNSEVGTVSAAEQYLSLLKNEKKLPYYVKREVPVVLADYYSRIGLYAEASTNLMKAVKNKNIFTGIKRKKRARYAFIVAQYLEQNRDYRRAAMYYKKTIDLKPPQYELSFYARIKLARMLDVKRNNSDRTKRELLQMAKEYKNIEYCDVIYYTLGQMEEKENNIDKAYLYYLKSVQKSTVNKNQKALSYLKLGEINFDKTNYPSSESYYDSTIATLPKDHPQYDQIVARKKTLSQLVAQIKTIKNEDSLQRITKMSDNERNAYIDKLIKKVKKDEEQQEREKEAQQNLNNAAGTFTNLGNNNNNNSQIPGMGGNGQVMFYFYTPQLVNNGITDFASKWGNRKYEDNWRRSNKAVIAENITPENVKKDTSNTKTTTKALTNKDREYYLKNLFLSDSLLTKSNLKIIEAYYLMGSIYKEELNNNKKAIGTFEELNKRFPKNKYELNTYYILYRIFDTDKNTERSEYFKNKILNEYPDSDIALLLKNPESVKQINSRKSDVEKFYARTYRKFNKGEYKAALDSSNHGLSKFGINDFTPKFQYIKAISLGKLSSIDSTEFYLKLLVAQYPKSDITPLANDILLSIKKQKNPELFTPKNNNLIAKKDTFLIDFEKEHILIAICPDDPKMITDFKTRLDGFSKKYYSNKQFSITSNLFGNGQQMIMLKAFDNATQCVAFYENLNRDAEVFKGNVKREAFDLYPISSFNLPYFYKVKKPKIYEQFYNDNYKNIPGAAKP